MIRSGFAVFCLALVWIAVACGDGGEEPTLPSPTPDTFDVNSLADIALQPEEVGLPVESENLTPDGTNGTHAASFGDDAFRIQTTITRRTDVISREAFFEQVRTGAIALIKNEQTYPLEGAELAFAYEGRNLGLVQSAVIAMRGDFVMFIQMTSTDPARTGDVANDATMRRYVGLVDGRIRQAINDTDAASPTVGPTSEGG